MSEHASAFQQQFIDSIRDDLCLQNMHGDQSNGAVIERVFTQIDSDVLTEPQTEAFICASTGSIFSKFILLV
jgi:hypothetical protein